MGDGPGLLLAPLNGVPMRCTGKCNQGKVRLPESIIRNYTVVGGEKVQRVEL